MKYYDISSNYYGYFVLKTKVSLENIPLKDYKHYFKEHWEFIAEHKLYYKPEIIDKDGRHIYSDCWACEYKKKMSKKLTNISCQYPLDPEKPCDRHQKYDHCPLKIFGHHKCRTFCIDNNSIYAKWCKTYDLKFVLKIANLEWEDYHENI